MAAALVAATPVAAAAAAGQGPAAPGEAAGDEIVVTGSRDRERAVRDFVEAVTVESGGQVARFATPVCPASFGLPAGYNSVIAGRIRQIAAHLGIGARGEGCDPNVIVVFAERGGEFLGRLREERPALFSALELAEIRRLLGAEGPVRAWQLVEPRGADGRPMERISWLEGSPPRYIPRGYRLTGVMPSLTRTATRQDLALALVVFDVEAIEGLTLLQLADHAAMRALAMTEAGAAAGPSRRSILGLFEDRATGAAPAGALTDWDSAYLAALYGTMNDVTAGRQRSIMARTMARELDSEALRRQR